jgi:hypothetical protein
LYDVLLSQSARESGLFNPKEVESILSETLASSLNSTAVWDPRAHVKKVWSLFVFEMWRQRFKVASI